MINNRFYQGNDKFKLEKCFENYSGVLTEEDQRLIKGYLDEKKKVDHISPTRERKIGYTLTSFKRFLEKPYDQLLLKDVLNGIEDMKNGNVTHYRKNIKADKPLSERTKYDFVSVLKPFLLWLADNKELKAWIQCEIREAKDEKLSEREAISIIKEKIKSKVNPPDPGDPQDRIRSEDLLTVEDIGALTLAANNDRDRAIINLLYESGCRVGELGRITWNDITFDNEGVKLIIQDTKTAKNAKKPKTRYSRLTISKGYLAILKDHTKLNKDHDFVFTTDDGEPITYPAIVRMLERTAIRADIKKKVNPHMFRHSRATALINENYQESVIKKTLWNNLNTKMFAVYVSLGDKDIDREFLSKQGIKIEEKRPKPQGPRPCGLCGHSNGPQAKHCNQCGAPLTPEGQKQAQDDEKKALEYSQTLEFMQKKMEEMALQIAQLQSKKQ